MSGLSVKASPGGRAASVRNAGRCWGFPSRGFGSGGRLVFGVRTWEWVASDVSGAVTGWVGPMTSACDFTSHCAAHNPNFPLGGEPRINWARTDIHGGNPRTIPPLSDFGRRFDASPFRFKKRGVDEARRVNRLNSIRRRFGSPGFPCQTFAVRVQRRTQETPCQR